MKFNVDKFNFYLYTVPHNQRRYIRNWLVPAWN